MTCDEVKNLIEAYLDDELDLVRNLDIERHLHTCPDCLEIYRSQRVLKAAFRDRSLYFSPPPALYDRVQKSLHKANRVRPRWQVIAIAASLAAVLVVGLSLWIIGLGNSGEDVLAQQVATSHIRSLMLNHLTDVESTNQHTVKPWFNNKLDFSPPVVDLAAQGYPLKGGRLDYLDNRSVAALIYTKNLHVINLFIWPAGSGSFQTFPMINHQGYYIYHWTKSGMNFWAISDVNPSDLGEFVQLIQSQT